MFANITEFRRGDSPRPRRPGRDGRSDGQDRARARTRSRAPPAEPALRGRRQGDRRGGRALMRSARHRRHAASRRQPDRPELGAPAEWRFDGVRVVRREGPIPVAGPTMACWSLTSGRSRGPGDRPSGSRGETVYYYRLYPFTAVQAPPQSSMTNPSNRSRPWRRRRRHRRTSCTAAARDLPPLRRASRACGRRQLAKQLRRFLELPGAQLDQLYSFARGALGLHDLERVDGELLPLLAQLDRLADQPIRRTGRASATRSATRPRSTGPSA